MQLLQSDEVRAVPVGVVQLGDEAPLLRRLGHGLHLRVQLGQVSLGRRLRRAAMTIRS